MSWVELLIWDLARSLSSWIIYADFDINNNTTHTDLQCVGHSLTLLSSTLVHLNLFNCQSSPLICWQIRQLADTTIDTKPYFVSIFDPSTLSSHIKQHLPRCIYLLFSWPPSPLLLHWSPPKLIGQNSTFPDRSSDPVPTIRHLR